MSDLPRVILHPGAKLGRYQLLCPLADGGMAAVWLGRVRAARGFERLVAIKTIKPQLREDARMEQMFLDEARIASRIHHSNVAQIVDLGESDELLYLVMEYVDGESLARTRRAAEKRGAALPLEVSLRILADVCAGLHAAHELKDDLGRTLGVVHRDVSPQNVLVTPQGEVKLIDFGIARARDRSSAETTAGSFKGKVPYMAPEQITGRDYDRRVDVWAVGVMLYELLAGARPFTGPDDVAVFRAITSGDPPPPLPEAVPPVVARIVAKALAHRVDDRFPSADAVRLAIEGALSQLRLRGSSGDVAAFVQQHLAVATTQRRALVRTAIDTTNQLDAILDASRPPPDHDVDAPTRRLEDDEVATRWSERDDATTRVLAPGRDVGADAPTTRLVRDEPSTPLVAAPDDRIETGAGTLTHAQLVTERRTLGGQRAPRSFALLGALALGVIALGVAVRFVGRGGDAPLAATGAGASAADPSSEGPGASAARARAATSTSASVEAPPSADAGARDASPSASPLPTNARPSATSAKKPPRGPVPAPTYDRDGI